MLPALDLLPAADFKVIIDKLKTEAKPDHWVKQMTLAAVGLTTAQQAQLWCVAARTNWLSERVKAAIVSLPKIQQGTPLISKSDLVDYWDYLSNEHQILTTQVANNYKFIGVPAGAAFVNLLEEKVIHILGGHTFKHFNVDPGNFVRSTKTKQMSFWPRTKKKSDIFLDARLAITNNPSVTQLLSQGEADWRLASNQSLDVDVPYPARLGFHRRAKYQFNLTQFYPDFDRAGGNTSIIMHEKMVIAIFSLLLKFSVVPGK